MTDVQAMLKEKKEKVFKIVMTALKRGFTFNGVKPVQFTIKANLDLVFNLQISGRTGSVALQLFSLVYNKQFLDAYYKNITTAYKGITLESKFGPNNDCYIGIDDWHSHAIQMLLSKSVIDYLYKNIDKDIKLPQKSSIILPGDRKFPVQ